MTYLEEVKNEYAAAVTGGIAEYRVQVEWHWGDKKWQPLDDSPWTGLSATELEIEVECRWYYRWRVRAIDRVGGGHKRLGRLDRPHRPEEPVLV